MSRECRWTRHATAACCCRRLARHLGFGPASKTKTPAAASYGGLTSRPPAEACGRSLARIGHCSLISGRAVGAASSVHVALVAFASFVEGRAFLSCTSGAAAVVSGATHHKIGSGNGFGPAGLPSALEPFRGKDKTRTRSRDGHAHRVVPEPDLGRSAASLGQGVDESVEPVRPDAASLRG